NSFFNLLTPSQNFWRAVAFCKMLRRVTAIDSPVPIWIYVWLLAVLIGLAFCRRFLPFLRASYFLPPCACRSCHQPSSSSRTCCRNQKLLVFRSPQENCQSTL